MARPKGPVTLAREERERRAGAYHEAGHAVVGVVVGRKIETVHIRENREYDPARPETLEWISGGQTTYKRHPANVNLFSSNPRNREWAEKVIMTSLAGALAQGKFYQRHSWRRLSETDRLPVEQLGSVHAGGMEVMMLANMANVQEEMNESRRLYLNWLAYRTSVILDRLWPEVELVAAKLLEQTELGGKEVERLVNESGNARAAVGFKSSEATA